MKKILIFVCFSLLFGACKTKASLTEDEEDYVQLTLAMLRARASIAQAGGDSVVLERKLDSVYKAFNTDSASYVRFSKELAENPNNALLAYQTIRDSLGLK